MATALQELRSRLLAIAYCNLNDRYQLMAFGFDQTLATLAAHNPAAAEATAHRLLDPKIRSLVGDCALTTAEQTGIDTSGWSKRREATAMASDLSDADPQSVRAAAERLWAALVVEHPKLAATLAELLTALPATWRQDLFQTDHTTRLPADPPHGRSAPPEIAAYSTDPHDCDACLEVDHLCRYHRGMADGQQHLRDLLATLAADSTAQALLEDRRTQLEAERAELVEELNTAVSELEETSA
ncbi:hypothetical protein AB0H07_39010 [Streptomyces sp. NPDC021354]|uniref:hypothetical protein n=1 Tax=Streptomyces sp. NPDC021354 TaxID=3154793 RepID=UPI0033E842F9